MTLFKSNFLQEDLAKVTLNGISYGRFYYSGEYPLKKNWFKRCQMDGNWNIPVFIDPANLDNLFVYIEGKGIVIANKIEQIETPDIHLLNDYYRKFNKVKRKYRLKKHRLQ